MFIDCFTKANIFSQLCQYLFILIFESFQNFQLSFTKTFLYWNRLILKKLEELNFALRKTSLKFNKVATKFAEVKVFVYLLFNQLALSFFHCTGVQHLKTWKTFTSQTNWSPCFFFPAFVDLLFSTVFSALYLKILCCLPEFLRVFRCCKV